MNSQLVLYVKSWCPWCISARHYLQKHGYRFTEIDVNRDGQAYEKMRQLSGQGLTPTLVIADKVLPDFGTDELEDFLRTHGISPT